MAGKRISMRKTQEIIRLSVGGLADRAVARACGVSATTVGNTVRAAKLAGLHCWPLPELSDSELREKLSGSDECGRSYPQPNFAQISHGDVLADHVVAEVVKYSTEILNSNWR